MALLTIQEFINSLISQFRRDRVCPLQPLYIRRRCCQLLKTVYQPARAACDRPSEIFSLRSDRLHFFLLQKITSQFNLLFFYIFSGVGFGNQKRNFDEIDRSGFNSFIKKNFDEIDRSGFNSFVKKNFDEIDRSGFNSFVKRNPDFLASSNH